MNDVWRLAADAVVGLHFAFLAYLLVGGFLAWRWPRTIVLHLLTAIWAVLIITTKVPCPLTFLQNEFRRMAGQSEVSGGFIKVYVRGTFYPADRETLTQALVGLVVLGSWAGYLVLRNRRRRREVSPLSTVVTG
jgi:uncharacterized membrane protein